MLKLIKSYKNNNRKSISIFMKKFQIGLENEIQNKLAFEKKL